MSEAGDGHIDVDLDEELLLELLALSVALLFASLCVKAAAGVSVQLVKLLLYAAVAVVVATSFAPRLTRPVQDHIPLAQYSNPELIQRMVRRAWASTKESLFTGAKEETAHSHPPTEDSSEEPGEEIEEKIKEKIKQTRGDHHSSHKDWWHRYVPLLARGEPE